MSVPTKSALEKAFEMVKKIKNPTVIDLALAAEGLSDIETRKLFLALGFVDRESRGNSALLLAVFAITLELINTLRIALG